MAIAASLLACSRNEPPAAAFTKTEGQLLVRAKSIKWGAAPGGLPQGAKVALLQGNPSASGRYVIRMQLPANYKIPFHSYPQAMDVTVVSGTLYAASTRTFEKMDPAERKDLAAEQPEKLKQMVALWDEYARANDVILPSRGPFETMEKQMPQRVPDDPGFPPLITKRQFVPPADMMAAPKK